MTGWYQRWVRLMEGMAKADYGSHDKENWLGQEEEEARRERKEEL